MEKASLYTDNELFAQIAEGDETAFGHLFNGYLPRLYPVILQIVHSESDTRDIIQDVFMRLWISREKLSGIHEPKNYIFRIAYNQSFRHLKKQLRAQMTCIELIPPQEAADIATSSEELLDLSETRQLIDQAIRELPDQSRKIYILNRISGFKPQQIAELLGISVQSVRNSLTRSSKIIKSHLTRHGLIVPLILLQFPIF